jgi:tetratricopeptide (TPR) repeat protein
MVMANSDNGFRIFEEVERAVFAEYGWPGADLAVVRIALAPAARARFVGQYLVGIAPFAIIEQDGRLALRMPFQKPVELVAIAPDRVVQRDTGRQLHIAADGSLEVDAPQRPTRKATRLADSARHHLFEIEAGRLDDAVAAWRDRSRTDPKAAFEEEVDANALAYVLMAEQPARAVDLLRLVAIVFPESSNAHDSLGEAYMNVGDKPRAIAEYEHAIRTLDTDPRVPADGRPARRAHAEAQLAKLRAP